MKMLRRSGFLLLVVWASCGLGMAQNRLVIRGGTLVDVRDGSLTQDAVIVLEGDRIASVSSGGPLPPAETVIDATGKYILPGLIDAHVHYEGWAAELFLNHGVTTVLDLGNAHEWIKAQKEGIQSGLIPGPRLFHSTRNLDGPPAVARGHIQSLKDPEDALHAMRQYVAGGVNAVKVYEGLSVEVLRVLVREANKANIPVIGHFKDVLVAAEVGGHGIEHLRVVTRVAHDRQAREEALKKVRDGLNPPVSAFMDFKKLPSIIQLMVEKGLFLNPTLKLDALGGPELLEKGFHYEEFDLLINNWRLRYIPLSFRLMALKEYQEIGLWHRADLSQYERDLFHQGYKNSQRLVKMFVDAGGKLYAGPDCPSLCTPGLGLHHELELLVDAGISPLQALQSATIHSAELMRMQDRLGSLEEGKVGDVLILDANPLENIRNTRKIAHVISRGRVLDRQYHADFSNSMPKTEWEGSSHYFPSPRIQSAFPEAFVAGMSGATLTVHGTGFIPYSFVRFNGQKLKTNFLDRSQLAAELPVNFLKPGTYAVTVENPDFAWGTTSGASDLSHLGIRDRISNEFLVLVKPQGGAPIFPHPREVSEK